MGRLTLFSLSIEGLIPGNQVPVRYRVIWNRVLTVTGYTKGERIWHGNVCKGGSVLLNTVQKIFCTVMACQTYGVDLLYVAIYFPQSCQ